MNSCLQCLSHTYELSQQCRALVKGDLNLAAPSKGQLATQFSHLVHRLWTQQNFRCVAVAAIAVRPYVQYIVGLTLRMMYQLFSVTEPRDLKKQVGKLNETFAGFAQQDSQELLRFLLDGA